MNDTPEGTFQWNDIRFYIPPDIENNWEPREGVQADILPTTREGYPSVTGILDVLSKPGLLPGALKLTINHILDNIDTIAEDMRNPEVDRQDIYRDLFNFHEREWGVKRNLGSYYHMWLYRRFGLEHPTDVLSREMDETETRYTMPLTEWYRGFVADTLDSEGRVFNTQLCYGGSLDGLVVLKDGRVAIYDLKTGKRPWNTVALQLTAYSMCDRLAKPTKFNERGFPSEYEITDGLPEIADGIVVSATGDHTVNVYEFDITEKLRQAVRAARVLWQWNQESQLTNPELTLSRKKDNGNFWMNGVVRERWVDRHYRVDCRPEPTEEDIF